MFLSLLPTAFFVIFAQAVLPPSSGSCTCTEGHVTVKVDVQVAADPSDGKFLNSTTLRHQQTTFQVFGTLCQPAGAASNPSSETQSFPYPIRCLFSHSTCATAFARSDLHESILACSMERLSKLLLCRFLLFSRGLVFRL